MKTTCIGYKTFFRNGEGKSDKVDARFISKYGLMRREELQPMTPLSDAQLELQQIMNHRDKLVTDKASINVSYMSLCHKWGKSK
ncbi:MAG: transposase [Chitinophagaceae bacterium]|nr:transposase [Chitinophagaceae bacterium]